MPSTGPGCSACSASPGPLDSPGPAPVHPSRVVPPAAVGVQSVAVAEASARSGKGFPARATDKDEEEGETRAMTHGSGHFGFESIVYVVLTVLVVSTLTMFANAVLNSTAII